jgi:Ser/Thr protein kinase RdoA (MazF antagonist)
MRVQAQSAANPPDIYKLVQDLLPQPVVRIAPLRPTPTPWAAVYEVQWTDPDCRMVVRLVDPQQSLRADIQVEFELADLLGNREIGPRIHHYDADGGLLSMEMLDELEPPVEDPEYLRQLADLLARLHATPVEGRPCLHLNKRDRAAKALGHLFDVVPGLDLYRTALGRFDALRAALRDLHAPETLCHNDLNPHNILYDGSRSWLIDFDHAGLGDPLFDVATLIASARMPPERADAFTRHYLGRPPQAAEAARLELLSCLVLLRYGVDAVTHVPLELTPRIAAWKPADVGTAFVFDHRPGDPLGWSVFRLSLGFTTAGLTRLAGSAARRALADLGLPTIIAEGAEPC